MADLPPPPAPSTTPLASLGTRVVARLVDGILVLAVTLPLILATSDIDIDAEVFDTPAWVTWSTWLAIVAYEVLATALTGKTLGKHVVGIRVVDATTGALPDLGQAARRAVPTVLGRVPVVGTLAVLLYLPALWSPRRQGAHDALAGTIVVRT